MTAAVVLRFRRRQRQVIDINSLDRDDLIELIKQKLDACGLSDELYYQIRSRVEEATSTRLLRHIAGNFDVLVAQFWQDVVNVQLAHEQCAEEIDETQHAPELLPILRLVETIPDPD